MAIVAATNSQSPLCAIAQCLGDAVYRVIVKFQTIWEHLQPFLKQITDAGQQFNCARRGVGRKKLPPQPENRIPLTPEQREIWDLLAGQALSGKEISYAIGRGLYSEDSVRQRIRRMKNNGWLIENSRGAGYWRPDTPPPEFTTG